MRNAPTWVVTFLLAIAAVLFLRAVAPEGKADPVVSAENPGPRGLLWLTAWLSTGDTEVTVHRGAVDSAFAADIDPAQTMIVVPPPEAMTWTLRDVATVKAATEKGAHLVILCDDDKRRVGRLGPLLAFAGAGCEPSGLAIAQRAKSLLGRGDIHFPALARRIVTKADSGFVPLYVTSAGDDVVATRVMGEGRVTVLADGSLWQNDGLGAKDNAQLWRQLQTSQAHHVIVLQTHHQVPYADEVSAAFGRLGPQTGFLCFGLLLLLSMLGLWPRKGDRLDIEPVPTRAAAADVHALASLYRWVAQKTKSRRKDHTGSDEQG